MTWDAYNRRKNALREVLAIAESRRDTPNAHDLIENNDAIRDAFGNEAELLLDLQMSWYQSLSGQLDRAMAEGADDQERLVTLAWSDAAAQMPIERALIDAHEDMPELQRALSNERALLARSAGIRTSEHRLDAEGERLRAAARAHVNDVPAIPDTPAGLFARIREALAA